MTKYEYKILSEKLYKLIDWERIYEQSHELSKKKFTKEDILSHIQRLILEYPDHFDRSVPNRIECATSVFNIRRGMINNYMYIISDGPKYIQPNGWFMTDNNFLDIISNHIKNGKYCVVINIKDYIRKDKIEKICSKLMM